MVAIETRRELLSKLGAFGSMGLLAPSLIFAEKSSGIEPVSRLAPSRMQLSLAAYSLRDLLKGNKDGWDLFKFVDYCHQQGLSGAELTSYYFPSDVNDGYIVELKEHCRRRGVSVSGGAIANDFCQKDDDKRKRDLEHTKLWIDRYALLGAGAIRVFAGNQPKEDTWPATRDRCVETLEEACKYAHTKGVYLALENHGGVTARAEGLLEIVRAVQAPSFGVNFDSGNFRSTEDPYAELASIAPYAINAQIKVEMFPGGKRELADLGRILRILKDSNYSGWVALEYEAAEPPLEAIPGWLEEIKKSLNALT
jgi:sugar phosphate isomerase/epimerase